MTPTINSVERQLRRIPPCQDCTLILTWVNEDFYEHGNKCISVFEAGTWDLNSLVEQCRIYQSAYYLENWVLVKPDAKPPIVFVPKDVFLVVKAIHLSKEGYYIDTPIKIEGKDELIDIASLFTTDNYFYINYDLKINKKTPVVSSSVSEWKWNDSF